MKVIVNNLTPLTVEDEQGNVLFQWLPEQPKVTTYINVRQNENIDSEEIAKRIILKMQEKSKLTGTSNSPVGINQTWI